MNRSLNVSEVRLTSARPDEVECGMIGYVAFVLDDSLKLDGIALRRTRRGHAALSYPCRRDRHGRDHALVRPLSDSVRRRIEEQVFRALGIGEQAA